MSLLRGLGNNVYTPSAKLDPGLLIAGSSNDCGPDSGNGYSFSSCTAGYGTLYANVSGTSGVFDGIHPGTFGIERIANRGSTSGNELDWLATIELCVITPLGCNVGSPESETVELSGNADGASSGATLTMPTTAGYTFAPATFNASLDSITGLHLLGRSATLSNGQAAPHGTQTVLHLPTRCGTADASLAATDSATPAATVTVPLTLGVTGCPTAKVSAAEPKPYTVRLDASRSALGTAGRTLTYQWSLPGGKTTTTKVPNLTHTFRTSAPVSIHLVVLDSLGAQSKPATAHLNGSTLTMRAPWKARRNARIALSGRLTGWHGKPALGHRRLTLSRCRRGGSKCTVVARLRTSAAGKWHERASFSPVKPLFVVAFNGGHATIGTSARALLQQR